MIDMDEGRSEQDDCQDYRVQDDDRDLHFCGELIGEASSFKQGKERWAEIAIYRTRAGKYVVTGIGRSILNGEVDKHWAQVCEEPQGVIEKLHMLDDDKSKYLPFVSKTALQQARDNDPVFAAAYQVEEIA